MSGGSYNYICYTVEEECVGQMYDKELDDMMRDLANLLHDLEWWKSSDTSEEKYRETVKAFKKKWFKGDRAERLKPIIEQEIASLRNELLNMIG